MKWKNKKRKLVIVVLSIFTLLEGYFFWFKPKYNQANANNASANATLNNAVEVSVTNIAKQQVQLSVDLPGRVNGQKISYIRPQIGGIIKKVKFVEGSFVKQGQQLYEIDQDIYKAALDGANKTLNALKIKRERYKNLLAQDAISSQEFDDINGSVAQAQADAAKAKKDLEYTKVLAPISGYIGKTNYTEGSLVTVTQDAELTTIVQLDPIYVDMEQPSKDVIAVGHHKEVPVTLITEDPNYKNTGTLKFSEMFADPSTDSVRLRALFSNKDKKLLPGMFVTGRINLPSFDAITVPQRIASRLPNGSLAVWVVTEGNIAKMRIIKAEKMFGDSWIVDDGLSEGDVVIYEGFQKVADGAKVNPVPLVVEPKTIEPKTEETKK